MINSNKSFGEEFKIMLEKECLRLHPREQESLRSQRESKRGWRERERERERRTFFYFSFLLEVLVKIDR